MITMWFNELEAYKWHYDYPRLAWDSGFAFGKMNPPVSDKNKYYFVDIDQIIKDRDISTVENNIPFVCQYKLDPEQAEILDKNFVKMFKISQLSVDYLLFCRLYLDHTVISLKQEITKLQQENSELKSFIEELEQHISVLTTKVNNETNLTSYKCDKCSKIFSSEVYLHSHQQRRHSGVDEADSYTNKLHLEIKELKERLNNTEKLIQDQTHQASLIHKDLDVSEKESKNEVQDIKDKFDDFKVQIEGELKTLELQKNFYEDKYLKLFEIASKSLTQKEVIQENGNNEKRTTQNGTQTELEKNKQPHLQTELTHDKNVFVYKQISEDTQSEEDNNDILKSPEHPPIILPNINEKLEEFEEHIESKVSLAFSNIEMKMEHFWEKLSQMQSSRQSQNDVNTSENQVEICKPAAKPRTKLTKPKKKIENLHIEHLEPVVVQEVVSVPIKSSMYDFSESDNSVSEPKVEVKVVKPPRVIKPAKERIKRPIRKHERSTQNVRQKVKDILEHRLQEFGISNEWNCLPKATFEKTWGIINHKVNLSKKDYKNYASIRRAIEKKVEKLLKQQNTSKKPTNRKLPIKKDESIVNTVVKPTINPTLYETDSDSVEEVKPNQNKLALPQYASFVDELKAKLAKPETEQRQIEEKNETKGVLKNYPSTGSLSTKKKVIFDIDSQTSVSEDLKAGKDGGSTTSLGSSLLDRSGTQTHNQNDVESLSDFDFANL